ncbi:MAG: hypothetical protein H7333_00445 [Bdellovibrionales bacterium]|nr:hypothetical protein [Oligoflexia bacterium]
MAVKKLKVAPAPFLVPEGLYLLPTAVLLFQKSSGILWANPTFEKEFGALLPGRFKSDAQLGLIRERPVTTNLFAMIGRHEGFVIDGQAGNKTPIELKVTQYGDASTECYLVLVEDVSGKTDLENQLIQKHLELQNAFQDLKKTQNALVQSAKLASLGELSSGIAHELNQPLQAIMGFSQELEYVENLSETGKEFTGTIISASKKMAEIIRSLRSFSREAGEDQIDTSVEHAVTEARKLMHHSLLQKGIEFECSASPALPLIHANPIQLEQVFVNFFSNARDAIDAAHPGKGKITVKITATEDSVEVSIKDDGCGMSDETKQKIFDPFFTTKPVGQGTGLGLSISYGILKKLKAVTEVSSTLHQGTEFKIRFPISQGDLT